MRREYLRCRQDPPRRAAARHLSEEEIIARRAAQPSAAVSGAWHYVVIHVIFWLAVCVLTSVSTASRAPSESAAVPPVTQRQHAGKVHLTLMADRQSMALADHLLLTVSVEAPDGTLVTLPEAGQHLGPFTVVQHDASEPRMIAPHTRQWQHVYRLEATASGSLTLPALTVTFRLPDAPRDALPQTLSSEPLPITVTTVVPEHADLTAPRDIAPPVTLTRRGMAWWTWAGIVIAVLGLLVGGWQWYRQRYPWTPSPLRQPAHLLALEALRQLRYQDRITRQHIEEFYVRLSAIVRQYVEWRFGLRAPEQTTEEFLAAVLDTGGFIATHQTLLSTFLHHCDLVKFARYQPTPDDMQQAMDSARAFIEHTADTDIVVEVPPLQGRVL